MYISLLLLGLAPNAQAKKVKVGKVIGEATALAAEGKFEKCLDKVNLGLGEERATDNERAELAFVGYQCAVRGGVVDQADTLSPPDALPKDLVAHAYLYMNAGRLAEARDRVAAIADPTLDQDLVEIRAQVAALLGEVDAAAQIAAESELRPGPRAVVAEALLAHRRPGAALTLLEGTCAELEGDGRTNCERLAPIAEAHLELMDLAQPDGAPEVSATAVHRIDYATKSGSYAGGNAFLVAHGEGALAITPLHLFGPPMGLPAQIASADLPDQLERVLFPHDALLEPWEASAPIALPGAEATGQMGPTDVAMFSIPAGIALDDALVLAEADVEEDVPVWIIAPAQYAEDPSRRMHPGTVRSVAGDGLVEVRVHEHVELGGISGAPIVNADGEVIGMAIGGGMAGPQQVALAVPVSAIADHIDSIPQ